MKEKTRGLSRRKLIVLGKRLLLHLALGVGAVTMLIPLIWCVSSSLKPYYLVFVFPPQWIPKPIFWGNYTRVFEVAPYARWYLNTAIVAVSVTTLRLFTASAAGYAFARLRFPHRDTLFLLYLGTLMIPGQVTLIPRFILIQKIGWIDNFLALIIPGAVGVFGTFLMRQFFYTVPEDLRDAAFIDGCNHYGIFLRIMMPLSGPALTTLAIFTFVSEWNSFLWPLIVTRSPKMWLVSVGLRTFSGEFFTEWGLLMAAACLGLIPTLLVYVAGQRYFVRSVSFTGLKG